MRRTFRAVGTYTIAAISFLNLGGRTPAVLAQQPADQKTLQALSARFSAYVQRRQAAAEPKPGAGPDAPASVESRLKAWGARTVAKDQPRAGTVFTQDAVELLRRRLREVLQGGQGAAARAELEEAAAEHIVAEGYGQIEISQPVSAPELPFSLADVLPRLPHGLEYRFSGDWLLLRDESTSVLIDFVTGALPPTSPKQAQPPALATAAPALQTAPAVVLPNLRKSVKFAVLGDTGTGKDRSTAFDGKYRAHAVAKLLEGLQASFAFPLALMLGDNMYTDPDTKEKFVEEVVEPYKALRAKGIVFRAVLGNHDNADFQLPLAELNFDNRRFYAFEVGNVRFVMLHSDEYVRHDADPAQDAFIKKTLETGFAGWTVAVFHHPLYSSGLHRNQNKKVREAYTALLDGRVRVAFTGHEHFYERTKTKPGPAHFVLGAAAKLREGDINKTDDTEKGFDDEHSVMLVEINQDEMYFQAVGLSGRTRDCGVLPRITGAALSPPAAAWFKTCQTKVSS